MLPGRTLPFCLCRPMSPCGWRAMSRASASTAFELGGKPDPMSMYLCDVYTVNANIAGICGVSIPAGMDQADADGRRRPIGIHLQAQAFEESKLLGVTAALEKVLAFDDTLPG